MAAASPAPAPSEEAKFPDRDITIARMASVERNSGAICTKFVHAFRRSCFHFNTSLSHSQVTQINPPRSALVAHIKSEAPNYVFPKCFVVGNDLAAERKVVRADDDEDVVKFRWQQSRIATVGSDEEREQHGSDEEAREAEEDNEEDLIGEYNVAQYEDQETGEDQDGDDDSDDND